MSVLEPISWYAACYMESQGVRMKQIAKQYIKLANEHITAPDVFDFRLGEFVELLSDDERSQLQVELTELGETRFNYDTQKWITSSVFGN